MFTRKLARQIKTLAAVFVASLVGGALFGVYALWPPNLWRGFTPPQPIDFSHRRHAGDLAIPCLYCHSEALHGAQATVPDVPTCLKCHFKVTPKERDGITVRAAFVPFLEYADPEQATALRPIPWVKVYDLPDFTYFEHRRHTGRFDCVECHGRVKEMEQMTRVQPLAMAWCLDCHRKPPAPGVPGYDEGERMIQGPTHCYACHR